MRALGMIENYPRATYVILDKAGHSLSWEQPDLFKTGVKEESHLPGIPGGIETMDHAAAQLEIRIESIYDQI